MNEFDKKRSAINRIKNQIGEMVGVSDMRVMQGKIVALQESGFLTDEEAIELWSFFTDHLILKYEFARD